jgi:hypothetical protein
MLSPILSILRLQLCCCLLLVDNRLNVLLLFNYSKSISLIFNCAGLLLSCTKLLLTSNCARLLAFDCAKLSTACNTTTPKLLPLKQLLQQIAIKSHNVHIKVISPPTATVLLKN